MAQSVCTIRLAVLIGGALPAFILYKHSISQPIKTEQIEEGCTLYYYPDNTVEISVYDMIMRNENTGHWALSINLHNIKPVCLSVHQMQTIQVFYGLTIVVR